MTSQISIDKVCKCIIFRNEIVADFKNTNEAFVSHYCGPNQGENTKFQEIDGIKSYVLLKINTK